MRVKFLDNYKSLYLGTIVVSKLKHIFFSHEFLHCLFLFVRSFILSCVHSFVLMISFVSNQAMGMDKAQLEWYMGRKQGRQTHRSDDFVTWHNFIWAHHSSNESQRWSMSSKISFHKFYASKELIFLVYKFGNTMCEWHNLEWLLFTKISPKDKGCFPLVVQVIWTEVKT